MNRIRKIPLQELIDILTEMHSCGIDFIDISGKNTNDEDSISISFQEEYVNPDYRESFQEKINNIEAPEKNINISRLTDDDINQLL